MSLNARIRKSSLAFEDHSMGQQDQAVAEAE